MNAKYAMKNLAALEPFAYVFLKMSRGKISWCTVSMFRFWTSMRSESKIISLSTDLIRGKFTVKTLKLHHACLTFKGRQNFQKTTGTRTIPNYATKTTDK